MTSAARQRKADAKLVAATTLAVLVTGGLVAGAILLATGGEEAGACSVLNAGLADDIRERLEEGGPYYINGGGNCAFWAALDGDEMVAVRPTLSGRDCTVQWRSRKDAFICGDQELGVDEVERYPTSIGEGDLDGAFLVDFRPPAPTGFGP